MYAYGLLSQSCVAILHFTVTTMYTMWMLSRAEQSGPEHSETCMNAWGNISLTPSFWAIVFNFIYVSIWIHRIFKLKALYFNSLIRSRSFFRNKCMIVRSAWPYGHLAESTRGLNLSRQNFKCFRYCFVKYSSVNSRHSVLVHVPCVQVLLAQRQTKQKEFKSLSKLWEIGNRTNKQRKTKRKKKKERTKNEQNKNRKKKTKANRKLQ